MTVTHPIQIDLVHRGIAPRLWAMQYDTNTRVVELTLTAQGQPWLPPEGAGFALAFQKADGTRGYYDRLADGVPAVTARDNKISVTLAHQVLTAPGLVEAALVITREQGRMAAFPFQIQVAADPSGGAAASEDYFNGSFSAVNAVLYTPQTLTAQEQAQVRENLGIRNPVKGVDYFTQEEKDALLAEFLAQVTASGPAPVMTMAVDQTRAEFAVTVAEAAFDPITIKEE